MACVRKYRGKLVVDYYDTNKKRHIEQVDGTREDADRRLAEVVKGGRKPLSKLTFKEYGEWWLENCAKSEIKQSTFEEYQSVLSNHLYPEFSPKLMCRITRKEVREFAKKKREEVRKYRGKDKEREDKRGFSRSTIRNIFAPMRAMYNQAIEDEDLTVNPVANVGRVNKKRRHDTHNGEAILKIRPLTKTEVPIFLREALEKAPDFYPVFLCALRTGLRQSELIGLKPLDLDFNSRFIVVQRNLYRGRVSIPKDNEPRKVDMSTQLTNVLDAYVAGRKAVALKREMEKPTGERRKTEEVISEVMESWLFTTPTGQHLDPSNLRKLFWRLLASAGISRIRFHDLRHTFATLLLQQGESLAYVRDQLGHSSIKITVDTYGHLVPGGNRQAVDKLDDDIPAAPKAQEPPRSSAPEDSVKLDG